VVTTVRVGAGAGGLISATVGTTGDGGRCGVGRLEEIREVSGSGHLSLLRVADIVVRMTHHRSRQAGAQG
jgi:hypothetical protein